MYLGLDIGQSFPSLALNHFGLGTGHQAELSACHIVLLALSLFLTLSLSEFGRLGYGFKLVYFLVFVNSAAENHRVFCVVIVVVGE